MWFSYCHSLIFSTLKLPPTVQCPSSAFLQVSAILHACSSLNAEYYQNYESVELNHMGMRSDKRLCEHFLSEQTFMLARVPSACVLSVGDDGISEISSRAGLLCPLKTTLGSSYGTIFEWERTIQSSLPMGDLCHLSEMALKKPIKKGFGGFQPPHLEWRKEKNSEGKSWFKT